MNGKYSERDLYLKMEAYKLRESPMHDYCKRFVAKVLTDAGRVCNRECAWMEYPICKTKGMDTKGMENPICYSTGEQWLLDECMVFYKEEKTTPQLDPNEWVPTYETCIKAGLIPVAIVDVACAWKGVISEIWEITKPSPLTKEKVNKIFDMSSDRVKLYEIKVDDIMSIGDMHQSPEKLYELLLAKAKKWHRVDRPYEAEWFKDCDKRCDILESHTYEPGCEQYRSRMKEVEDEMKRAKEFVKGPLYRDWINKYKEVYKKFGHEVLENPSALNWTHRLYKMGAGPLSTTDVNVHSICYNCGTLTLWSWAPLCESCGLFSKA